MFVRSTQESSIISRCHKCLATILQSHSFSLPHQNIYCYVCKEENWLDSMFPPYNLSNNAHETSFLSEFNGLRKNHAFENVQKKRCEKNHISKPQIIINSFSPLIQKLHCQDCLEKSPFSRKILFTSLESFLLENRIYLSDFARTFCHFYELLKKNCVSLVFLDHLMKYILQEIGQLLDLNALSILTEKRGFTIQNLNNRGITIESVELRIIEHYLHSFVRNFYSHFTPKTLQHLRLFIGCDKHCCPRENGSDLCAVNEPQRNFSFLHKVFSDWPKRQKYFHSRDSILHPKEDRFWSLKAHFHQDPHAKSKLKRNRIKISIINKISYSRQNSRLRQEFANSTVITGRHVSFLAKTCFSHFSFKEGLVFINLDKFSNRPFKNAFAVNVSKKKVQFMNQFEIEFYEKYKQICLPLKRCLFLYVSEKEVYGVFYENGFQKTTIINKTKTCVFNLNTKRLQTAEKRFQTFQILAEVSKRLKNACLEKLFSELIRHQK